MDTTTPRTELGRPDAGTPYHHTLRTPSARWWKPVVGILAAVLAYLAASLVTFMAAIAVDTAIGGHDMTEGLSLTPAMFAASLVSLILLIPTTWGIVRGVHGQPWGFTGSVEGLWRWRTAMRALPVTILVFAVYMAAFFWLQPAVQGERSSDWLAYALVSVLLMPLQAAAEEIFFRGYVLRAAGSWFSAQHVAMIVGTLLSSLLFMAAHGAGDLWLNIYYFMFGVTLSLAARYSGGLEVPVLVHATNNVVSGVVGAYFTDMKDAFDRSAGVGGPFMLIQIAFIAVVAYALVRWMRHRGTATLVPAEVGREIPAPGGAAVGALG